MNLRAIGEYATYYGFDISKQEERIFALYILSLTMTDHTERKNTLIILTNIAREIETRSVWEPVSNDEFSKIIQDIATPLSIKITKAKLTQTIPILGATVGAGFNAYFTNKTCNSAYYLYRERF